MLLCIPANKHNYFHQNAAERIEIGHDPSTMRSRISLKNFNLNSVNSALIPIERIGLDSKIVMQRINSPINPIM